MPSVERKDDTRHVHSLRGSQEHDRLRQVFWSSEKAGGDLREQSLSALGRVLQPPGSVLAPGTRQFTVTPCSATSMASALVRPTTPALAAA